MRIDEYIKVIVDKLPDSIPIEVREAIGQVVLESSESDDANAAWIIENWVWGEGFWYYCEDCDARCEGGSCDYCGKSTSP